MNSPLVPGKLEKDPLPLIVAIDGPSGVGKTTVAAAVARELQVPYLSTGAMYRSVALKVLDEGVDPSDREAVEALTRDLALELSLEADGRIEVLLDGKATRERIQGLEIAQTTSQISTYNGVRRRMVELQKEWARRHGAVLEGRDIGTKVFPNTPHKFFLEAPMSVRVDRRWKELRGRGRADLDREEVAREVEERDERDRTRPDSPLQYDDSYQKIGTGERSPEEVVETIVSAIRASIVHASDEGVLT